MRRLAIALILNLAIGGGNLAIWAFMGGSMVSLFCGGLSLGVSLMLLAVVMAEVA